MLGDLTKTLDELAEEILEDGVIDAKEAAILRERIFADGKIDREEADLLFRLNDAVSGKDNHPAWQQLFVQAITAHVLGDDKTPGSVDEDETSYLVAKIQSDGLVDEAERALLVNIIKKASSTSDSFCHFVLSTLKTSILADGVIDEAEVRQIRTVIYGAGGGGGTRVDRAEADFLFELNNATSQKANHESWKELFVDAISSHVLEDETSPGVVDDAEASWLIEQIEGDGQVDDIERALLTHIKAKATAIPALLQEKLIALGI